jgi:hypothetical protein
LKFVQFQNNASHHHIIGQSPYKALFSFETEVGLTTYNLPLEDLKIVETENSYTDFQQSK